eukprot:TRINITY_DN10067_c0_g2_i1.p1 TRINITY_DN10067_c0_g2~~TRINITY_DN10067_c0_g2_i1.p1  ORF type:complete len:103 (+),score=32.56 TRINITY_DN10067_c0_g2_i1:61-369(+)
MAESKEFVLEALSGLTAWSQDPANAAALQECKDMVAADTSAGKMESKKGILQKMVSVRCAEKPDSRLSQFQADVTPLWDMLMACRDDEEVDKVYAQVAVVFS